MARVPCVDLHVTVCTHKSGADIILPVDAENARASAGVVELAA
jgi:hypothetical protein